MRPNSLGVLLLEQCGIDYSYPLWCFKDTAVVASCLGSCPNYCNYHGLCNKGTCNCDSSWGGDDCSNRICLNNCIDSNHGTCNQNTGTCDCKSGWTGSDCSHKTCPNNCIDDIHGVCNNGVCQCTPNFKGDDCSIYISHSKKESKSTGATVGYVILAFVLIGIVIVGAYFLWRWKKKRDAIALEEHHFMLDEDLE